MSQKDDTISRQAAIDEIKALYEWHDTVTEDRTIDHLKRLPSAQPEQPKKGKWIHPPRKKAYDRFCSECQKKCWYVGNGDYPFCPNCGADMRGEAE